MYKAVSTGTFTDNEYVIYQLILAYSALNDYGQIVPLARKVYQRATVCEIKAHIAYATALEFTGNPAQAEEEFKR